MNKSNASKWIELGSAMIQGKKIQLNSGTGWRDIECLNTMSFDPEQYRIKPDPKKQWYRVALKQNGNTFYPVIAEYPHEENAIQTSGMFMRWLTDRIEYTLPEGDA